MTLFYIQSPRLPKAEWQYKKTTKKKKKQQIVCV